MIKAVIFDMDGTVVKTTPHDFAAWQQVFSKAGKTLSFETFKRFLGKATTEILKEHFPHLSRKKIEELAEKKDALFSDSLSKKGIEITPGFPAFAELLKSHGYKRALATGGSREKIDTLKKYLPLDEYFSVIVTTSDVTKGKPYPDLFLETAQKLGVKPQECIVIEDARNGIEAAYRADMKCIAITTTHKKNELQKADKIIDSFDELTVNDINHLGR